MDGTGGAATGRLNVALEVDGRRHEIAVEPRKLLSDALREDCGALGVNVGCEHGVCGACTVLLDGEPVRACLTFAVQAHGHAVRTVASLESDGRLHALQQAFTDLHGLQCGFCTPGILVTFEALLRESPEPTEEEVRAALGGNLCRCTGYHNVVAAVLRAAHALAHAAPANAAGEEAR